MEYQRKPIKGYEGKYEVDTLGNVWSLHYHNTSEEKVLVGGIDKDGYRHVQLWKNGKPASGVRVSRLVAEAFVPNPSGKPFVDHINAIRSDNRAENLRWADATENMSNPLTLERRRELYKTFCKPVIMMNIDGQAVERFESISEASRQTGMPAGNISKCLRGIRRTCGGYKWRYMEERYGCSKSEEKEG